MTRLQNIRYNILLALLRLVAMLPMWVLYATSDVVRIVLHRIVGYRVKVVRDNLERSFPERSREELRRVEHLFYVHLCDCVVETVKLLHISDAEMLRRVDVRNAEYIETLAQDNRPIVLMLGHYGNWEWVQEVTKRYSRPSLNSEIYRKSRDEVFDKLMHTIRSRFNTEQIVQAKAVRTLIGWKMQNRQFLVGFISDQRPNSNYLNHWMTFLGQDTPIAVGAEEIGEHVNAHYVYLDIERPKRGHYRMTFCPIDPDPDAVEYPYVVAFMRRLEATIRRAPQYWLWSHKRWRKTRKFDESLTRYRERIAALGAKERGEK